MPAGFLFIRLNIGKFCLLNALVHKANVQIHVRAGIVIGLFLFGSVYLRICIAKLNYRLILALHTFRHRNAVAVPIHCANANTHGFYEANFRVVVVHAAIEYAHTPECGKARALLCIGHVHKAVFMRGEQRRAEREQEYEHYYYSRGNGSLVLAEAYPGILEIAYRLIVEFCICQALVNVNKLKLFGRDLFVLFISHTISLPF